MFFYVGGAKWLRGVQKSLGVLPVKDASGGKGTNGQAAGSGTTTPVNEKTFMVPPSVDAFVSPR